MSEKTIYLHIGQPKTGTSSIQRFCIENVEILNRAGIGYELMPYTYLKTRPERNARFLSTVVRDENRQIIKGGKEKRMEEAFGILAEQLTRYDSILLTDERLWNFFGIRGYDPLIKLQEFAKSQGARVCVVAYVRPQDDWIVSLYRQRVQDSDTDLSWEDFLAGGPVRMSVHYEAECDRIAEIVGRENMIFRVYDRSLFPGGKIETDFLDALGITDLTGMKEPVRETNPSLTNNYAEILRIFNTLNTEEGMKLTNRLFEKSALDCSVKFAAEHKTTLLSDAQRQELRERFEEENERVNEKYLQKGKLTLKTGSDLPVWSSENEEMHRDTLLFIGSVAANQQEQIRLLEEEVKTLKKQVRGLEYDLAKVRKMVEVLRKVKHTFSKKPPKDSKSSK